MKEKIRIYRAEMETSFGVDSRSISDDPKAPKYASEEEAIEELKSLFVEYVDKEEENGLHSGSFGDSWADFEYKGFEDHEIPDSVIQRIKNETIWNIVKP